MKELKVKKYFLLDITLYLIIIVHTIFWLISLDYTICSISVIISFIMIGSISFICLITHDRCIDIYNSVYIFSYVFFFMAPLQQYLEHVILWKGNGLSLTYGVADYLKANFLIGIHLLLFNWAYRLKNRSSLGKKSNKEQVNVNINDKQLLILSIMCLFSFVILLGTGNIWGREALSSNASLSVQLFNILRYFPVCSFILYVLYCKASEIKPKKWFLGLSSLLIILLFFPTNGNLARYLLFGTYIAIAAVFASNNKHRALYFTTLYFGFCYAFSASRHMTSFADLLFSKMSFSQVDFDAYQILLACIKYVDQNSISFGKNIFSALLFLVPRSIWKGKMIGTASIVVAAFGSWQINVSTPFIAELYFAFGSLGCILGGILMGRIVAKIDSWSLDNNLLKQGIFCIIVGMSIYILRGSLLAAFAFTGGLILSMIFIFSMCRIR